MIKASFKKYDLHFKHPSGTSRGVLRHKTTYFLQLLEGNKQGLGECGLFKGLSADDVPNYEDKLRWLCANINSRQADLIEELKSESSGHSQETV